MVRVAFTANLRRHLDVPTLEVPGGTVHEALSAVFAQNPALRGYVLDDQGEVRRHVSIFVGGEQIRDRAGQSDVIPDGAEIYIMQALSGG